MKKFNLKRSIQYAALPIACAGLLSACASYERVVHTTTPAREPSVAAAPYFDQWDTNRDGRLSRAEVEPLGLISITRPGPAESADAMFHRLDMNRDGFLSRHEAGTAFNAVPGGSFDAFDMNRDGFLSRAEATPHLQWLQNRNAHAMSFDSLDVNRDGYLSRNEAAALVSSARLANGRWIIIQSASFDRFDIDRDGFLSRAEAEPYMNGSMFNRYDTNRDGFLSRSEAAPYFESNVGTTGGSSSGTVYGPR